MKYNIYYIDSFVIKSETEMIDIIRNYAGYDIIHKNMRKS